MLSVVEHCQALVSSHGSVYAALLGAGLLGSLTHCAGMCGPLVATQVATRLEGVSGADMREWHRLRGAALLPYHSGRITTYTLLGAIAGGFSSLLFASAYMPWIATMMLMLAGALFLLHAFDIKLFTSSSSTFTASGLLAALSTPFWTNPKGASGYALGVMLGFLPCGMVMAALMAASTTGSVAGGALGMALFGLATVPALFVVGLGSAWLQGRWRKETRLAARGAMAINGILLCSLAVGNVI